MKIAFFLENIQFGGLDTFVINLLNNWDDKDELTLICNSSHPGLQLLKSRLDDRVIVIEHEIPLTWDLDKYFPQLPNLIMKILKLIYFIVDIPIQVNLIKKFFKKNKFDKLLVVNGGYPGGDSCISASIAWGKLYPNNKSWHNFHNLAFSKNDYTKVNKLKYYRSILIDKILFKYTKGFISVSKSCIDSLNVRGSFSNSKKEYIYNGTNLNLDMDKVISIRNKYNLPSNSKVIAILGVYEPRKGQEFIIKAFKKYCKDNNIYLFMFGKGENKYIGYLNQLIGDNKNIFLEDYQSDIREIYKGIDILAIPSQSLESFGYTAVEAMAYKVPTVVTNIGGLPEVVKDETCGYVVDYKNPKAFIDKILFLCENEEIRNEFGDSGFKRYNDFFRAKIMSNKYEILIKYK